MCQHNIMEILCFEIRIYYEIVPSVTLIVTQISCGSKKSIKSLMPIIFFASVDIRHSVGKL